MVRVLIGDALVNEDARLQVRINQLVDRVESSLKQALQLVNVATTGAASTSAAAHANALTAFVVGRWQLYAKSGFKRTPNEYATEQYGLFRI